MAMVVAMVVTMVVDGGWMVMVGWSWLDGGGWWLIMALNHG